MNKLIDDIIELILEDMDCHHEVDHDEDGVHTSVEYSLNDEMKVTSKIKALLKPEVTEEWIEKKANKLMEIIDDPHLVWGRKLLKVEDFIRKLIEEKHDK